MSRKEIIYMIFGGLVLIFLISASYLHNSNRTIKGFEINFLTPSENYFLNENVIKESISTNNEDIMGLTLNNINIKEIEDKITKNPYIDSVQVIRKIDGTLALDIKANKPIGRVKTPKEEFYISTKGTKMPLSKVHSEKVMLIVGDVNESEYEDLSKFLNDVSKDTLFRNHFIGMEKLGKRSYNIYVNHAAFYIELGTLNNYIKKLNNLKLFYEKYLNYKGLNDYEKLSLKFLNQVVATKSTVKYE